MAVLSVTSVTRCSCQTKLVFSRFHASTLTILCRVTAGAFSHKYVIAHLKLVSNFYEITKRSCHCPLSIVWRNYFIYYIPTQGIHLFQRGNWTTIYIYCVLVFLPVIRESVLIGLFLFVSILIVAPINIHSLLRSIYPISLNRLGIFICRIGRLYFKFVKLLDIGRF